MGNFTSISYEPVPGTEVLLTAVQVKLLKKYMHGDTGTEMDSDYVDVKKAGKYYKLEGAKAEGSHGWHKDLSKEEVMKKFKPIKGTIVVRYHDMDDGQIIIYHITPTSVIFKLNTSDY